MVHGLFFSLIFHTTNNSFSNFPGKITQNQTDRKHATDDFRAKRLFSGMNSLHGIKDGHDRRKEGWVQNSEMNGSTKSPHLTGYVSGRE